MFGKKRQKELQFTCSRCQHDWYRPFVDVNRLVKPKQGALKGARMQATASRVSLGGSRHRAGAELQLGNMQSEYDRQLRGYQMYTAPTCPSCGSGSVTTRTVEI